MFDFDFDLSGVTNFLTGKKPTSGGSSTKSKFERLKQSQADLKQVSQLVYPPNILNGVGNGHFILININRLVSSAYQDTNYKVNGDRPDISSGLGDSPAFYGRGYTIQGQLQGGGKYQRSKESIVLSMPDSFATSYGIEWNAVELGLAGRLAREISAFDQNTLRDVGNALGEGIKNSVAGAVESLTGLNVKQTAELYTGTIQNPFLEVLFKGVRTRDMNFDFKFLPKNAEESKLVAEIIRRLKFHMHPEFKYRESESSYFLYPSTFDITFMRVEEGEAKRNVWLHRVNTCALTGLSEDSSVGGPAFHKEGAPVARKMSLQFIELAPLRKSDFENAEDSF